MNINPNIPTIDFRNDELIVLITKISLEGGIIVVGEIIEIPPRRSKVKILSLLSSYLVSFNHSAYYTA